MMRRFAVLALACCLAACAPPRPSETSSAPQTTPGGPPPVARRKVTIYSPHGREVLEPFEQRLEAAHPEIDLEWLVLGSQECLDRIRAEKANPGADLWWGAPHTMFQQAAAEGLLAPYRPSWAEAVAADKRDPDDLWYGQYLTPGVIVYNTDQVTAESAPQDWDDLLKPEWKDRILIRDPANSGTMRTFVQAMVCRQTTEEAGWDWLLRLDANTKSYPADPSLLWVALNRGEGAVTVWNLRDVEIQKREHGYHLAYVIPKSGCPVVTDAIALVAGGPEAESAKVVYDFVTDTEQLYWAAEQFDCMPARTDIDRARLPERMPREVPELPLPWDKILADGTRLMEHWDQHVRGQGRS